MKLLLGAAIAVIAGCSDIQEPNFNVVPRSPPEGWAQLRVLHVAADVASQDVYQREVSEALMSNLSYGFAQGFYEVAARDYTIDLRPAGAVLNGEPTYSQDVTLGSAERVTYVLTSGPFLLRVRDDLARVDLGAMQVVNTSSQNVSLDFDEDGDSEISGLAPLATARATTAGLAATTVSISADSGAQTYALPERPSVGDVLLVISDSEVTLLTYSFTVTTLEAP